MDRHPMSEFEMLYGLRQKSDSTGARFNEVKDALARASEYEAR